jgi:predicted RNA binding protein YcfA (HicA-like mRNA interferase family)
LTPGALGVSIERLKNNIFYVFFGKIIDLYPEIDYLEINERERAMTSREVIRLIEQDGWYFIGATGSHHYFKHPTKPGKVTVVHPSKDFKIKTLRSMELQSGVKLRR